MVFTEVIVFPWWVYLIISVTVVWDLVWRGIGLWRSSRNNDFYWFLAILAFSTLGILPIVYLFFFQDEKIFKGWGKSGKKRKR